MRLFALLAVLVSATPVAPHPGTVSRHVVSSARRAHHAPAVDELFSLRARRRFAAYMRMRLLEMREAGLERAAAAVERRMSADDLLELKP